MRTFKSDQIFWQLGNVRSLWCYNLGYFSILSFARDEVSCLMLSWLICFLSFVMSSVSLPCSHTDYEPKS